MRQEAACILGDQGIVLSDTDARRVVANYPRADESEAVAKLGQRGAFLENVRGIGVGPIYRHLLVVFRPQINIGPLTREERLANPAGRNLVGWRVVDGCLQEVRMPFVELP